MKTTTLIIVIFVLFFHLQASGQYQSVLFWIKIHDTSGGGDSLIYGYNVNATFFADSAFGELSSPPDAPGFFAKFTCPRYPPQGNWGLGLVHKDIRALPLIYSPLHVDTFCVYFKNDDVAATNAAATLQWSPSHCFCDSMILVDTSHIVIPHRINMFKQQSIVLPDIYDPEGINPHAPVFTFRIYVYGVIPDYECGAWPDIYTDAADNISAVSATLHGRIDPNCQSLDSVRFQYGPTKSYGYEVSAIYETLNRYSATLVNLNPSTTYHFRIVPYLTSCSCISCPEYGDDSTFTTEPPSSIFWIRIEDNYYGFDTITMLFGNHVFATCGVDTFLNEYCRLPSAPGFLYEWGLPLACLHSCPLGGLLQRDLRPITAATQLDTFWLRFANDVANPQTSATLRWPSSTYIQMRTDSLVLEDPTHTLLPQRINMSTIDSIVLERPYDPAGVNPGAPQVKLIIYKYGIHMPLIDLVKPEKVRKPTSFALYQNYPNPFNPSTTIEYTVPHGTNVRLEVFNVLGQRMATLVDEEKGPGSYNVAWDTDKIPSGVYFYRITAGKFSETKKMLLLR